MSEMNIEELKKMLPKEMLNDMKAQAEKYGMDFDEYIKQCMGAAYDDPDLMAY